jgi:hypothetical protein
MVPVQWLEASQVELSPGDGVASHQIGAAEEPKLATSGLTGKKVSHYRLLKVIGGGGMGVVYRAEDVKLGRAVALKLLPEDLGSDPKALERFEREPGGGRRAGLMRNLRIRHALERRRSRYPHPAAGENRIRKTAVAIAESSPTWNHVG